jgi:hypothetical protein
MSAEHLLSGAVLLKTKKGDYLRARQKAGTGGVAADTPVQSSRGPPKECVFTKLVLRFPDGLQVT